MEEKIHGQDKTFTKGLNIPLQKVETYRQEFSCYAQGITYE